MLLLWGLSLSFLLFLILKFFIFTNNTPQQHHSIKGPINLPIIGSLYSLDQYDLIGSFNRLRKKYGQVFAVKFGSVNTIIINDINVIEEAYRNHPNAFNDRPPLASFLLLGNGNNITFSNSIYWTKIIGVLNNLLTGTKSRLLEDIINQEYDKAEVYLKNQLKENDIIDISQFFKLFQIIIVYNIVLGKSFQYDDDDDIKGLLEHMDLNESIKKYLTNQPSDFIPLLKLFTSHAQFIEKLKVNNSFFKPFIQDCINRMDNLEEPKCLLDNIILQVRKDASNIIDINYLDFIVFDLIMSSFDTVVSTFSWMVLYLVNNQDIQESLNQELNSVATTKYPLLKEKRNYTLFNAIIKETQRHSPPTPFSLPRYCTKDTIIDNYYIPKDTQIIANIYSVNHDQAQFENPHIFNPYRYINGNASRDLTFSIGPRGCPGKSLASDQVFLIGSKLFKVFKFERITIDKLDEIGIINITYQPKPYLTKVSIRS